VGEILVENNTVYDNGSAGIESFRTNGAVITENTVYGNNTANVLQTASVDEIFINQSSNDTVTNNITTAPDSPPIGVNATIIATDTSSFGSTSLAEFGNNYFLYTVGTTSGPELKYNGAAVTQGEFGTWSPIGAVQTESGYDIAWKDAGSGAYTVWTTDVNGNYVGNAIGEVSGNSYALESLETTFNQDLNGDGVIGLPTTVIQVDGSTSLTEIGPNYFLYHSGSGPELKYNGAAVTRGEFGTWTPIGAVQTASG
jgi:parallel beta-helix repeat protein